MSDTDLDTLSLLSHSLRRAVLRELAEYHRREGRVPLSFSELRSRVGSPDSGNFSYHLERLVGSLVVRTEGGYRLSNHGQVALSRLLAASSYDTQVPFEESELEDSCPFCDCRLVATYEHGEFAVVCENDHRFMAAVSPNILKRELDDVLRIVSRQIRNDLHLATERTCSFCHGEQVFECLSDTEWVDNLLYASCKRCGAAISAPPGVWSTLDSNVVRCFSQTGIDVARKPLWTLDIWQSGTIIRDDPIRFCIEFGLDDSRLIAVVTETGKMSHVIHLQ